ncbi:hypothetical protein PCIT_b0840 [Pseudoalteromonas citrea]|uniref:DUF3325 domain-containing protein n=2 Tax=Pseudoalteromonas citrea TaxID=43655 RepID=A0AAD4FQ50_9GAMM|nr:DUF3325 domain-containing protein [Pseudoalteromonas citrea]KAF7764775.1 hypothetical protein PCIT_b0840 [Pseudoalteromonas citrea]
MIQLLAFLFCFTSFTGFALAKSSHYKSVFGVRVDAKLSRHIRIVSWVCLLASALMSMWHQFGYGSILLCGYMAVSVMCLALLLSYMPAKLRSLIYLLPGLLVITAVLALL